MRFSKGVEGRRPGDAVCAKTAGRLKPFDRAHRRRTENAVLRYRIAGRKSFTASP